MIQVTKQCLSRRREWKQPRLAGPGRLVSLTHLFADSEINLYALRLGTATTWKPSYSDKNDNMNDLIPFPGSPHFSPRQVSTPMVGRSALAVHQSLQAAVSPAPEPEAPAAHARFSAKHEGLYLYVGRVLRPLWQLKCVTKSTVDGKDFVSIRK